MFPHHTQNIGVGCRAISVSAGSTKTKRFVQIFPRPDLPNTIDQATMLEKVRKLVVDRHSCIIDIEPQDTSDFQITVNKNEEYEVLDGAGDLVPNLKPALRISDSHAAEKLIQRLVHLAKYYNIRDLQNNDPNSTLLNKLQVEWVLDRQESVGNQPPRLNRGGLLAETEQNPENYESIPQVATGTSVTLKITNLSTSALNITVLDLEPSWEITQILPEGRGADFEVLDPGKYIKLPLYMTTEFEDNVDIIKVIATVEPTSFRWLELPSLGEQQRNTSERNPTNSLEELCAALTEERKAFPRARSFGEWTTTQVMIRTY
jgi:hypothetical protein